MLKNLFKKKVKIVHPFIVFLKQHYENHHNLVGVEIGQFLSQNIINELSMNTMFCINTSEYEPNERITFIQKQPIACNSDIPINLNFVYINDNTYDTLKQIMVLYYPKLSQKGVLGGNNFNGSNIGVVKAVMEFCRGYNLQLQGSENSWWIIKE